MMFVTCVHPLKDVQLQLQEVKREIIFPILFTLPTATRRLHLQLHKCIKFVAREKLYSRVRFVVDYTFANTLELTGNYH